MVSRSAFSTIVYLFSQAHYADWDGFVVLHGTDTMAYTSSALAFMLQNLGKIVVLTGSQVPMSQQRNDGQSNLQGMHAINRMCTCMATILPPSFMRSLPPLC